MRQSCCTHSIAASIPPCARHAPEVLLRRRSGRSTLQLRPLFLRVKHVSLAFSRSQFHWVISRQRFWYPGARFHQQRISPAFRRSNFRANMSAHGAFLRSKMKTRRSIYAIAVQQSHRPAFAAGAHAHQFFGHEAPSRKLKAERACSSTYVNRRSPPRTSAYRAADPVDCPANPAHRAVHP